MSAADLSTLAMKDTKSGGTEIDVRAIRGEGPGEVSTRDRVGTAPPLRTALPTEPLHPNRRGHGHHRTVAEKVVISIPLPPSLAL